MKINHLEVDKLNVKLDEPISISFATRHYQENFFLRLHADNGLVGWGEGAPFKLITLDSQDEALEEAKLIAQRGVPDLESADQFYDAFVSRLQSHTLRAAFDTAAHDLLARQKGIPVYQLYRATPRQVPNSVTVFIKETAAQTQVEAARLLQKHPHLQLLKIKLKGADDLNRCKAIREVTPGHMKFVLDANQGFSDPEEGVRVLDQLIDTLGEIIAIEEPCPKGDYAKMKFVKENVKRSRVLADESCVDEVDLEKIIAAGAAHGINIKLQKAGGITAGKRMAKRAAEAGLFVMLGSMFEDALAVSSGVHFGASTENVLFTDLDMDLEMPRMWEGQTPFDHGGRTPLETPGFGFQLQNELIEKLGDRVQFERVV